MGRPARVEDVGVRPVEVEGAAAEEEVVGEHEYAAWCQEGGEGHCRLVGVMSTEDRERGVWEKQYQMPVSCLTLCRGWGGSIYT